MTTTTIPLLRNEPNIQSFSAGQVIFQAGDPGSVMYGVIEGSVEIVIKEKVVETVEAGGIVGEMALIDTKPRSATARAKSDCKLAAIDQHRFMMLVTQNAWFSISVMQVMAERLRRWGEI